MGLRAPMSEDRMRVSTEVPPVARGSVPDAAALGVGRLLGESFSIFFRRIHWFTLLAFIPQILAGLIAVAAFGGFASYSELMSVLLGDGPPAAMGEHVFAAAGGPLIYLLMLASLVCTLLLPLALSVLAAYDAKLGRPVRLGRYFAAGLAPIVPLLVCWLVVVILWIFASIFLLLPGLWVLAVFSVVVPAIVIERAGFGGLGRSVTLTRGYRWPILGAMILVVISASLLGIVVSVAAVAAQAALLSLLTGFGAAGGVLAIVLGAVLQGLYVAISYGLPCVAIALIYARLREIKEGTGVDELTEVFA